MIFTDKEAIKLLNRVRFPELEENIETYEEREREGRSDLEVLRDEAEYILDMYSEGGNIFSDDLEDAREWMRETKNGTRFRCTAPPTRQQIAHWDNETAQARESINSYNRLKRLVAKLRTMA